MIQNKIENEKNATKNGWDKCKMNSEIAELKLSISKSHYMDIGNEKGDNSRLNLFWWHKQLNECSIIQWDGKAYGAG